MDLLETVRHVESECHVWFEANNKREDIPEVRQPTTKNATSEICMFDGSWTHDTFFGGCGWT